MFSWVPRVAAVVAALSFTPSIARAYESDPPPRKLRYQEGKPIPWGYHLEEHRRDGFAIGGGFMILGGGLIFALGAAGGPGSFFDFRPVVMVMGGALALGGTPLLIIGLATSRKVLVRNDSVATTVVPMVSRESAGIAFVGQF